MKEFGLSTRMTKTIPLLPPRDNLVETDEKEIIRLDHAENYLLRPDLIEIYKSAVTNSLTEETLCYPTGFGGNPTVLKALASVFNRFFKPAYAVSADDIVTTAGSGSAFDAVLCSVCDQGDEILVLGPMWYGFGLHMKFHANVTPIIVEFPSFRGNMSSEVISRLEKAYDATTDKKKIRALLVCNPNNPTDECYSEEVLLALMSFCYKRDLHYISDEVYAMCAFNSPFRPFISALSLLDRPEVKKSHVHMIWSLSKDFGSPGVRMACVVSQANKPFLAAMTYSTFWQTSSLSHMYAIALLTSPELPNLVKLNNSRLRSAYETMTAALQEWEIEYLPVSAGVSLWAKMAPKATTWEDESDIINRLKDNGLAVGSAKPYGGINMEKGWVRILFAVNNDVLKEVIRRMEIAVKGD